MHGGTRTRIERASTRLQKVEVGERSLAAYFSVVPVHTPQGARPRGGSAPRRAHPATQRNPVRGGVSKLLRSGVPLLRDLGLDVDWQVITGDEPFFRVTKAIHNGLQATRTG